MVVWRRYDAGWAWRARVAVFGSVARREARPDSDIDLLVEAPEGTSSFGFIRFEQLIEQVLGRGIDMVGGALCFAPVDDCPIWCRAADHLPSKLRPGRGMSWSAVASTVDV